MKKITILALDHAIATSVTGTMDIFSQTGLTWNQINGTEPVRYFDITVVSQDGQPVECLNDFMLHPQQSADDIHDTDLLIISSIFDQRALDTNTRLLPWIQRLYENGTVIASVCTGSFFLALTGLLDYKSATTHWGFAAEFEKRYPKIMLAPGKLITEQDNLLCSGACNSYIDLAIYLIEKYLGNQTAVNCSKALIHDFARSTQAPYAIFNPQKDHQDEAIGRIQAIFENNPGFQFSPNTLSKEFGMSRRTLERRFRSATGDSPLTYIQKLRVENGKHKLETTEMTFDEIAFDVGYDDSNFYRKIFHKHTGLLPADYRARFKR